MDPIALQKFNRPCASEEPNIIRLKLFTKITIGVTFLRGYIELIIK